MEDYKKHIKIIGTAAGNAIIPGFGGALVGGAIEAMFDGSDDSEEERKVAEERFNSWYEIANNLRLFRLQDRKSIMFLSDEDIGLVWNEKYPGDCEIIYLPYSLGIPDGITLDDTHIEEGALYVYDPRNEYRYYKANEISQVLIKDKFREIKQIFESLGATQIDITFRAQKDEKHEYNSNNSQNVSGRYGAHRASVSHSGAIGGTNNTSDFRQLEIHKRCTGKTSHLNYNKCYWYQNDVILQDEVRSIKAGSTLESNFVDTTKSYCSLTATRMDKIEAEYKKDYAAFEKELEDYKSRLDADTSIIEHYKDQDVLPIEVIFQEIRFKLDEAEEQIRFFIEAKQQKTMEIENEIKSNKK